LGREHDPLAAPFQSAAEVFLGEAVAARGVDQRDAGVERGADQAVHVAIGVAHSARAEADRAHREPGRAERPLLHVLTSARKAIYTRAMRLSCVLLCVACAASRTAPAPNADRSLPGWANGAVFY